MLPNADCDIPDNACCTTLFDIADHLRLKIYNALLPCYSESDCGPSAPPISYVTLGNGDDAIMDALTVAIESVAPSGNSIGGKGGAQVLAAAQRVVYTIRLRESGWPTATVVGEEILPPDPTAQHLLARHAYAHGEKMYRALHGLYVNRELVPVGMPSPGFVQMSTLRPLLPTAGVVGFVTGVTMDLPWGVSRG